TLVLAFAASLFAASPAAAADAPPKSPKAGSRAGAPASSGEGAARTRDLTEGYAKVLANDIPGGVAALERAAAVKPESGLAAHALAQAHVLSGDLAAAEKVCASALSGEGLEPAHRSKLLFAHADVLERQKRWVDARAAWQAYAAHAAEHKGQGSHID